jgi:hypothetical protein
MVFFYYLIIALFVGYGIYFIYQNEKDRERQLNLHLLHAKGILTSNDIKDKRNWFISRFIKAENHLVNAQAKYAKEIEFQSVTDISNQISEIKNNSKN